MDIGIRNWNKNKRKRKEKKRELEIGIYFLFGEVGKVVHNFTILT